MTTYGGIYHYDGSSSRGGSAIRDDSGYLCQLIDVVQNSLHYSDELKLQRANSVPNWPQGYHLTWSANGQSGEVTADQFNALPSLGFLQLATWSRIQGDVVAEFTLRDSTCLESECADDSDCPDGEKCVDGECQPCNEQQATHFQIRAEFEELVTLPDGSQVMYLLSGVYPIGSGVSNQIIQLAECSGAVWYYPRIRFCDENGEPRPYTGNLALYGYCNPDGSSAMWVNPWNNIQNASWLLGQKAQMDLHFSTPLAIPRVLIEFIDESDVIWESDCSGVAGDNFPPIEPVPPTEPDEPDEPEEPLPPDDIEEPLPPSGPQPPQEGLCPCEEYIGRQIGRAADILYSGLIALKRELAQGFREIVIELWEKRKLDYQLSMFFQNQQFQIMQAQHLRLYEIRQTLDVIRDDIKKGLVDGDDGLVDIVKTGLQEGDKGLVDFVKDFTEQYEPVTIENEYRTQSHRVIDNLDEVVNKL